MQQELRDAEPERFYVPAYLGARGWVALDLEAAEIDWPEVTAILQSAYRLTAPKRLAQQVR
ncbi:MmcQ/YjbR family DNA-binding protein [Nocardia jiangxiensis]|uniref:MmcQ/YjbR family DNA-binding protein n=1 Tax=Nocardia jiangxiensis TaxID=282685 RepID=A0ABW6RRQ4_9NOCA|nr:MmcQ/YjbR family DNA-binding protein [Nocardia jiangxiensis]